MKASRVTPGRVALVIAVVGILGAGAVFLAGSRIHANDRRAIVMWEAGATPALDTIARSLPQIRSLGERTFAGGALGATFEASVTRLRRALEDARAALEDLRTPTVIEAISAAYLNTVIRELGALTAVHQWSFTTDASAREREHGTFTREIGRADRSLSAAATALKELRARFDVP